MRILVSEKISPHKYKTPEGYLICADAILARTGKQEYKRSELFGDACDNPDEIIEVDRPSEEVFSPKTMASFENKPVTIEHPDEDVNVENYKIYAVGFLRDVRKATIDGREVMVGNLVITDKDAIKAIETGELTDLSCGYDCDIADVEHPSQSHIQGNHIALCEEGRAGIARIIDSEIQDSKIKDDPWMIRRRENLETAIYKILSKHMSKDADTYSRKKFHRNSMYLMTASLHNYNDMALIFKRGEVPCFDSKADIEKVKAEIQAIPGVRIKSIGPIWPVFFIVKGERLWFYFFDEMTIRYTGPIADSKSKMDKYSKIYNVIMNISKFKNSSNKKKKNLK